MITNPKSDVDAKAAYITRLLESGYDAAKVTNSPADITAVKGGETYYYEIKFTRQDEKYFGAATLTEWIAALENEDHFKFVVAFQRNEYWEFHEYSPEEFMQFSYVPPFKVYFNVAVGGGKDTSVRKKSRTAKLTRERVRLMSELYAHFRDYNAV